MELVEFDDSYFQERHLNDSRRLKSFSLEKEFILKFANLDLTVCDVGCSTGEFLSFLSWKGAKYGLEINKFAANEARKRSIKIIESLNDCSRDLEVIIMRGTIQHLPSPFEFIESAYKKLAPGGVLLFLATPNIDSIYYRIFRDLPALDYPRNFWLPGAKHLKLVATRVGFNFMDAEFPYFNSGYASLWDIPKFLLRFFSRSRIFQSSFPGNMMNMAFAKPLLEINSKS